MRKNNFIMIAFFVAITAVSAFAKPMEALSEYNVFLIHGAGSSLNLKNPVSFEAGRFFVYLLLWQKYLYYSI